MWILELELDSEKQFVGKFAIKHNISTASYNLSYYKDKKWIYLIGAGFIFGEEKNKRAFIKDLKKQSFVKEYEFKNDFGVGIVKQPLFTEPFWNRKVIQVNPSLISSKQKKHIWYLASFDRKALEKILNVAEKKLGAKLLKFKQQKLTNISFTQILPNITDKQKRAFELAVHNGYYGSPRKVGMKKLAKLMKVSYSTFQEHLRKAEEKIIPNFYQKLS